jgi:rubrerythrin
MNMENRTRDYYQDQSKQAAYAEEKKYFEALADEEKAHHAALLDYYEYLKIRTGWFYPQRTPFPRWVALHRATYSALP